MKIIKNRPLGTNEKVFWVLDQTTTTHFAVVAEIDGNATEYAWRNALGIVQKRHSNLSVKISGSVYATAHFESVEDCQIPFRIIYTKRGEDWNSILEEELRMPFDHTIAPLARAVLIQQSGKSIFIFLSNHSIGDGMSAALLVRDVLTVLSGKTIENLSLLPALDELAGVSINKPLNLPTGDFDQTKNHLMERAKVKIQRRKLSASLTDKLIKRSKYENTTVHGALSAALVLALKQTDPAFQQEPVRILHPLSARTSLGIGDNYGLLINIVTLPYAPKPEEKFWEFAKNIREGISSTQNAEWINGDISATSALFNNDLEIQIVSQALRQGTQHEILLTNLGQISFESDFGELELKALWGPMVLTAHETAQTVGVATFNGELTLTLTGVTLTDGLLDATEKILDQVCRETGDVLIEEIRKPNAIATV
ncbi:Condensation domain-containing protein [Dyadobacter koreensis]|uniref:Phthiocerol/phthiodiolone dimycocerosyl transferase n=1 Tax=Dyadobacter koreensis TaxID=408657 RepID=A0A1H7A6R7_9BACT|nr:hypothetical protein [Dyadobacter koreensis]SEJ61118.1 Condensation domain-containing protein [Dyadobacter koreensis]